MGKSKPPAPTPPKETAAASTSTNVGTAIANANLQNVNQITPDGTLTYDQTGNYVHRDPYTGSSYNIPQFTATQTLSEQQQAIKDQSDQAEENLAGLANQQSGFLQDYLARPVDLSRENIDSYVNDRYLDDFNEQQDRRLEGLHSQLSNQGIKLGSEAYSRAIDDFNDSRSSAQNNLYGDFYNQAQQSILAERNAPINEITALLSGSQVSNPNFVPTNMPTIPTTDTAGIINNYDQTRYAQWQQQQNSQQNLLGGLFGLGANLIASDERVKKDKKKVGELRGHGLYEYRYKGENDNGPKHIGVMAQQAQKKRPDAVVDGADGVKRVDYGKLFGAQA